MSVSHHVTAVARKRPRAFCQKCRWQVTAKHAYTLDATKSEWADYVVQAYCPGRLSMQDQISSVCRASFLALERLTSIRPYLSERTSARPVAALITSRLDYCNSVLAGLPAEQIGRQQRVQSSTARLVLKEKKKKKEKKKASPYNTTTE